MDQEAHWFICKDGLKRTCEHNLMRNSVTFLGFVEENHGLVHDVWSKHSQNSQHSLTFIEGLFYFFIIACLDKRHWGCCSHNN